MTEIQEKRLRDKLYWKLCANQGKIWPSEFAAMADELAAAVKEFFSDPVLVTATITEKDLDNLRKSLEKPGEFVDAISQKYTSPGEGCYAGQQFCNCRGVN